LIKKFYSKQIEERKLELEKEVQTFENDTTIPLFVLPDLIQFPDTNLSLFIYETRYKTMLRRCLNGSKVFGIVPIINNEIQRFGTLSYIQDVKYTFDGKSYVNMRGKCVFQLIDHSMVDGYHVGNIEFINNESELEGVLKERVEEVVDLTFKKLGIGNSNLRYYEIEHGKIPNINDYSKLLNWISAILPISADKKIQLLKLNNLDRKIEMIKKYVGEIQNNYNFIFYIIIIMIFFLYFFGK
jgi:Lon protease-like protein